MIDLAGPVEQHGCADLGSGIGAEAAHRVLAQVLPKPQGHAVAAIVLLAEMSEFFGPLFRGLRCGFQIALAGLALVLGLFQFARQFHHDLIGLAMLIDDQVDDPPELVEPDMHGRVGDPAIAGHVVMVGVVAAGDHVPLQQFAIVGQRPRPVLGTSRPRRRIIQHLTGAPVRMMPPHRSDSLRVSARKVGARVGFDEGREDLSCRRLAQPAITLWQRRAGGCLGMGFIEPLGRHQPGHQFGMFGIGLDGPYPPDDIPLRIGIERRPAGPQPAGMAEAGPHRIAGDRIAVDGFEREAFAGRQLERLGQG